MTKYILQLFNFSDYRALQDEYYRIVDIASELIDCVSLKNSGLFESLV